MWNNSSYQNPKSKIQDPIFLQAPKLCIPENKIKTLDKYKIKLIWHLQCQNGQNANTNSLKKNYEQKKVVYNSKFYHILIWCVQLFFARPIKSSKTIPYIPRVNCLQLCICTITGFTLPLGNGLVIRKVLQCKKLLTIKLGAKIQVHVQPVHIGSSWS
jgi:hypothetical protein